MGFWDRLEENNFENNLSAFIIILFIYTLIFTFYGFAREAADIILGGIPFISNIRDFTGIHEMLNTSPLFFAAEYFKLFLMTFVTLTIKRMYPDINNGNIHYILFEIISGTLISLLTVFIVNKLLLSQVLISAVYEWVSGILLTVTASLTVISIIKIFAKGTPSVIFFAIIYSIISSRAFILARRAFLYATLIVILVIYLDAKYGSIYVLLDEVTMIIVIAGPVICIMLIGIAYLLKSVFAKKNKRYYR
ncbi:MAG: hypothetical protein FWE82_02745 [Defluviitaleaceae bacterium]|nr:hypothetical protein [Defluviitaleaceae bacterium]